MAFKIAGGNGFLVEAISLGYTYPWGKTKKASKYG
jgi:hypothetical protein